MDISFSDTNDNIWFIADPYTQTTRPVGRLTRLDHGRKCYDGGDHLSKVRLLVPLVELVDDIEALAAPDRHSYLVGRRIGGRIPGRSGSGEVERSGEREIERTRVIKTVRASEAEGEIGRMREREGERLGRSRRKLRLISDLKCRRSTKRAKKK
ncbi:hypothetical protein ACLOJK_000322 [Asimina triloba]